ncbi:MAG: LppX_LprAFG lipoprotein [Mycobacteriaceae bacterium]|nr:LppX_LprAFG lipoprotein [Mycobacteriaceae bacterium]
MQTRRRLIAVILTFLALSAAPLAACSSNKSSTAPLPDAATLLKDSSDTTKNLKSVHLEIKVTGNIPNLPVHTLSGDLTNTPDVAAKGNANITVLGQTLNADFVVADTHLFAALTPDKWSDFGPAADIYDPSVILDPNRGLANVLANFSDPKADGRETINGVQTVRVKGTISAEAISNIVPGVANPVPGTAWIREDGNHDLVRSSADISSGNSIELTLSDWNKPVTVTKPAV